MNWVRQKMTTGVAQIATIIIGVAGILTTFYWTNLSSLANEVAGIRTEHKETIVDVAALKADVASIKEDTKVMREDIKKLLERK